MTLWGDLMQFWSWIQEGDETEPEQTVEGLKRDNVELKRKNAELKRENAELRMQRNGGESVIEYREKLFEKLRLRELKAKSSTKSKGGKEGKPSEQGSDGSDNDSEDVGIDAGDDSKDVGSDAGDDSKDVGSDAGKDSNNSVHNDGGEDASAYLKTVETYGILSTFWNCHRDSETPFLWFRGAFYLTMAYHWHGLNHGPFQPIWETVFAYEHVMWAHNISVSFIGTSELAPLVVTYVGIAAALLSIRYSWATFVYAVLQVHYMMHGLANFVNHDYLFALLSVLMCLYYSTEKKTEKRVYLEIMRGQIVVVYFFASLWKLYPEWQDGTICRNIFIGFEEDGVARGIPWRALEEWWGPTLFVWIARGGFVLDFSLFLTCAFLPAGHLMLKAAVIFHSFTGITMAQRIGYSFPAIMFAASILSERRFEEDRGTSHAQRVLAILADFGKQSGRTSARCILVCWLCLQWTIPLRGPLLYARSFHEFKYTMAGYRFSWTMMMHSKASFIAPGYFFVNMFPRCSGQGLPNIMVETHQHLHPEAFSYPFILGPRRTVCIDLYPELQPRLAGAIVEVLEAANFACPTEMQVYGSVFTRVNNGPFVRMIDPTVDLAAIQRFRNATWDIPSFDVKSFDTASFNMASFKASMLRRYQTLFEDGQADPWNTYMLQGFGTMDTYDEAGWYTFLDRDSCLSQDPLAFFQASVIIRVLDSPVPIKVKVCRSGECRTQVLKQGKNKEFTGQEIYVTAKKKKKSAGLCAQSVENVRIAIFPVLAE